MSAKRLTKDEINHRLLLEGRNITMTEEYIGNRFKTKWSCVNGHEWYAIYNNIQRGSGCPVCFRKQQSENTTLTKDEINNRLQKDDRGITLIGEYVNNRSKSIWQCARGHQWSAKYDNIYNGRGCPNCAIINQTLTKDQIIERLRKDDRGITLIGEYLGNRFKTTWECKKGHQWSARYGDISQDKGCPTCAPTGFDKTKPAWRYILLFTNSKPNPFIKFGITNNIKSRLDAHRKNNGEFELKWTHYDTSGYDTHKWELDIKQKHGGRYVTKHECPDGWTETLPPILFESITTVI